MSFQQTFQKPISTTNTTKPKTPDITITNPLDKKGVFVNLIEIVPNPEFTKKGKIIIEINGVKIFDNSDDSDAFLNVARKQIPLSDIELIRGSTGKIEIFAWNGTDSNTLKIVIGVEISESSQSKASSIIPMGKDVFNLNVSTVESLFSEILRAGGDFTQLIDMEGYKKLIVTLTKASPDLPPNIPTEESGFQTSFTSLANAIDGSLATSTNLAKVANQSTGIVKIDFGSVATRHLKFRIRRKTDGTGGNRTTTVFTSDTDSSYNSKVAETVLTNHDTTIVMDATEHSFRFVKIDFQTLIANATFEVQMFEIFDALKSGGIGNLAFEVLDPITDTWTTFIASTEFGTFTSGDNSIVEQVGDTTTVSVSGKTYALPSTQTNFRGKYTIGGDGKLKNAVSILKVA